MRAAIKQNDIHCLILHPSRAKRTLLAESRTASTRNADSASSDRLITLLQKSIDCIAIFRCRFDHSNVIRPSAVARSELLAGTYMDQELHKKLASLLL